MPAAPKLPPLITEAEYLALERNSEIKHELIDGEIYAMSGASRQHNLIVANVIASLHAQLRKQPCETYPSDMKVHLPTTGSYAYPDLSVMCGKALFSDEQTDVLLNPTLIIEVLSPSTEGYDRGLKAQHYRTLTSLQSYLLIAQDRPHIERFSRQADGRWLLEEASDLEATLALPSIGCTLALSDVYERVTFEGPDTSEDTSLIEES